MNQTMRNTRRLAAASLFLALAGHAVVAKEVAPSGPAVDKAQVQQALSSLAIPFEQNTGQFGAEVAFLARTFAGPLVVTRDGKMVYSLPGIPLKETEVLKVSNETLNVQHKALEQRGPGWQLTESLVGAASLRPVGSQETQAHVSRFTGTGSFQSATWKSVNMGEAWPGIEVELVAGANNVEKLFHVAPRADARRIKLQVEGAKSARLGDEGALILETGNGEIAYTPPVAWQDINGVRMPVEVRYKLHPRHPSDRNLQVARYGFALADYDSRYPLVIDPLIQSTYVGGDRTDHIYGVVIASNGDVIVAGTTHSANLPCTSVASGCANGAQTTRAGTVAGGPFPTAPSDAFITRLSADLKTFRQSTFLGGTGVDSLSGIVLAADGDVIVAGITYSADFPCTRAETGCTEGPLSVRAGNTDGFVARLSGDLRTLRQSTYLGGINDENISSILMAPNGDVLVAGSTESEHFPCASINWQCPNGAQSSYSGGRDGFITRLSGDLRSLRQSTYLGASGLDGITAMTLTSDGDVVAVGYTNSVQFPCTSAATGCTNGAQRSYGLGRFDGFVARLAGDLRTLRQSTFAGGSDDDGLTSVVMAANGEVIVAGNSGSLDFPCTSVATGCRWGAQRSLGGATDVIVSRLSGNLRSFRQSTYLGGSDSEDASALLNTSGGDIVVAGWTVSADFPCTRTGTGCATGAQSSKRGNLDGFIARLPGDLRTFRQATYLGGSAQDSIKAMVMTPNGDLIVAGTSYSNDYPCTNAATGCANGAAPLTSGSGDGFVTRISSDLAAFRFIWSGMIPGMAGMAQFGASGVSGENASCTLDTSATGFGTAAGAEAQAALKAQYPTARLLHDVFAFRASGCAGETLEITATYPQALPGNARVLKWGPPGAGQASRWYDPAATISTSDNGTSISYRVIDDGAGDSNTTDPGVVVDPIAMVVLESAVAPIAVPTLSQWALLLMGALLAGFSSVSIQRRGLVGKGG
ncbi:IPTL-CTERM sorting domain-containing protein [Ottowia thiooxydans]|uniref:IPTL-CTERM sorting domain-containing protein n=1 Tax=Ottowia thiooxydans TaxID=219182 RepID=UPI0003FE2A11|nr:IPTL-CTERM sorting domain-containing protein [Ottowia thiooxydans]